MYLIPVREYDNVSVKAKQVSFTEDIAVTAIILEFCNNDFYKEDYHVITSYFAADYVSYGDVISNIRQIAESGIFS